MSLQPPRGLQELFQIPRPGRRIEGIAAALLPFDEAAKPDWEGYARVLDSILSSGLQPAVNMDTGYVHLLDDAQRRRALEIAQQSTNGTPFVAGAFVEHRPGALESRYKTQVEEIVSRGGTPILFQSTDLKSLGTQGKLDLYRQVAADCDRLLVFELGEMFAPFGEIYTLEFVERLMEIESIAGLKHSSLDRQMEWNRLELRDRRRPEFKIYTGNDLAIDMVIWGSDYLLGLATFAPDIFAKRDALWEKGDSGFFQLNDWLQFLGAFAFRNPVPAYRHSAAQLLGLRGLIDSDRPHPRSPHRPDSDREVLAGMLERLSKIQG